MQKIKEFLQNNKKIIWIFLSIILTIGINISVNVTNNIISCNNGNQIMWLFICIFIYIVLKYSNKYQNKRLKVCSSILAIIITICQVLGIMTKDNWIINEVIITKEIILFILFKFVTYYIVFYNIIKIIFRKYKLKKM